MKILDRLFKIIDKSINKFFHSGAKTELSAVDQFSFIWFLRLCCERDHPILGKAINMSWEELVKDETPLYTILKEIGPKFVASPNMIVRIFGEVTESLTLSFDKCKEVIEDMNLLYEEIHNLSYIEKIDSGDLEIECYNYLLKHLYTEMVPDYNPTPQKVSAVISTMIGELVALNKQEDSILELYDPCCGTGSLLATTAQRLLENSPKLLKVVGRDISPSMTRISTMLFLLNRREEISIDIQCHNALGKANNQSLESREFDYAVSHSTFLGAEDLSNVLNKYLEFKTDKLELLMLTHTMHALKPEGYAVALIPGRVLIDDSKDYLGYRKYFFSRYTVHAIVSLPLRLITGYPNSPSYLIVLQKKTFLKERHPGIFFGVVEEDSNFLWNKMFQAFKTHLREGPQDEKQNRNEYPVTLPYSEFMQSNYNPFLIEYIGRVPVNDKEPTNDQKLELDLFNHIHQYETSLAKEKEYSWWPVSHQGLCQSLEVSSEQLQKVLQDMIIRGRIEAVNVEGQVVYQINDLSSASREKSGHPIFSSLSKYQLELVRVFKQASKPIPIHEARKKMKKQFKAQFTVQMAKQTVHLLHRVGWLEPVNQFYSWEQEADSSLQTLDLWKIVEEGDRTWKFMKS
ncbi:class I SAM-dependent DNA methyltransferase [Priestia aryabhattai]|uniref:HsdM family class I SAM-dependent methyltransferase n=1 Tax=Priestia aryabhattai TaxID=412384 RepID=UPI0035ABCD42